LGDRLANLRSAIQLLPPLVEVVAQSPIYQTPPWGYTDQPEFLNQVITVRTSLPPLDLLAYLKEIEIKVGRTPTFRYGPRQVDLDILFYVDWIVDRPELQIPHPRMHERAFVLVPLNDLSPGFEHPLLKVSIQELLQKITSSEIQPFIA
jgi:2-amino-4-hydroxy-6-hydroxymethyldihydropteridine diphosphokinase